MSSDIWVRIKSGDKSGLKDLYNEYFDILFSFGKYFHRNEEEVEDAIQNIFIRFWDKRKSISPPNNTKAYLMTCLRNEIYEQFRKAKPIDLVESFSDQSGETEETTEADSDWQQKKVTKAMDSLSTKNREVIFLKYRDNLTNEEIAEVLGINYQSVRNLLHRAIKQMRKSVYDAHN